MLILKYCLLEVNTFRICLRLVLSRLRGRLVIGSRLWWWRVRISTLSTGCSGTSILPESGDALTSRFLYTNELLFDETQDHIRNLVTQQSIGSAAVRSILVAPSTNHHPSEWDWRHLTEEYGEPLSATVSADHDTRSIASTASSSNKSRKPSITIPTTKSTSRPRKPEPISPSREIAHSRASSSSYSTSLTRTAGKGIHPRTPDSDPHSHPTCQPHPACAMSIYMLAHQYRIEALEELAKKHILSHLTHSSCIPVL
jgi:hypothetical protein